MTSSQQDAMPHRCWGRTSLSHRCARVGAWWWFCPTHQASVREWSVTVVVILVFLVWLRVTQQIDEAYTLLHHGDLFAHQSKDAEALRSYQTALTLFARFGMAPEQEQALTGLAHVYARQGNDAEAVHVYQVALHFGQRSSYRPEDQLFLLHDLGDLYTRQGKYGEAIRSYQALLTIYKQLDEPQAQAKILEKIGDLYTEQGDKKEALPWFTRATPFPCNSDAIRAMSSGSSRGSITFVSTLTRLDKRSRDETGAGEYLPSLHKGHTCEEAAPAAAC